jgi:hypothetical protein
VDKAGQAGGRDEVATESGGASETEDKAATGKAATDPGGGTRPMFRTFGAALDDAPTGLLAV